jgi:hypothetical protein
VPSCRRPTARKFRPAERKVGHHRLHRREMQSTALKILIEGADASPVGRKATK